MQLKWFYYDPMTLPEAKGIIDVYKARNVKTEMLQNGDTGLFTVRALLPASNHAPKGGGYANRVYNP